MNSEILLLTAPYSKCLFGPLSAVPCLVSQLKNHGGYSVAQYDLNIEHMNFFLTGYRVKCLGGIIITAAIYRELYFKLNLSLLNKLTHEIIEAYASSPIHINKNNCSSEYAAISLKYQLDSLSDKDQLMDTFQKSNAYRKVISTSPVLVGFSISTDQQLLASCLYSDYLKATRPQTKIVFGGWLPTRIVQFDDKEKLEELLNYCDFLVIGEGETAISLLADFCVSSTGDLSAIPNLCYIAETGDVRVNEIPHLETVESLPPPDYSDVDFSLYLSPTRYVSYQASRGCFWGKCGFCGRPKSARTDYRIKPHQKVVDDLVYLKETVGSEIYVYFADEAIAPEYFAEIVNEMDKRNDYEGIKWASYMRISSRYEDEIIAKARKNGYDMVFFGVETFSERLSHLIRKGINVGIIEDVLRLFKHYDIKVRVFMMSCLPSQTIEEMRDDMENILLLSGLIDSLKLTRFELTENTDMYYEPELFNIIAIDRENKTFTHHKDNLEIDMQSLINIEENEYRTLECLVSRSDTFHHITALGLRDDASKRYYEFECSRGKIDSNYINSVDLRQKWQKIVNA